MLKKAFKPFLIAISILLLIAVRFLYLNQFPVGMDADQVEVTLSAKTINYFGVDSSGTPWYSTIFGNNTKAGIAALPSILISPINYFVNFNLLNTRIIFVIINTLTILFLSLLAYELTKTKQIFFITMFISLINPWLFSYSRLPTEAPVSLLFFIIGLYLFVKDKEKYLYFSLPFFIASFYSYFGAKPILIVLIPIITLIKYIFEGKKQLNKYLIFVFIFMIFIGSYFYLSKVNGSKTLMRRSKEEILILNPDKFSSSVNEYRNSSIEFPFKNIIINKYTFTLLEFSKKYISWISSDFLFWKGDPRAMYTFGDYGLLYLFDAIFILFGIIYLKGANMINYYLMTLLVLAPIPSALSLYGDSFFYRGFLLLPTLILIISFGYYYLIQNVKAKYFIFIIMFIYLLSFFSFLLFYFFRYPIKQHNNNFVEGRLIANYILRNNAEITVVTSSPYSIFNEYVLYNNIDKNLLKNKLSIAKNEYIIKNLLITNECPFDIDNSILVIDSRLDCKINNTNYVVIQNPNDSGVSYKIYSDKLCNKDNLTNYRREHLVSDYNIEKMTDSEFCNRWIQNGKTN